MGQTYITSENWLKFIGKAKLQSFQDCFAKFSKISLIILDLNGKPLTIWSNAPLVCTFAGEKCKMQCHDRRKKMFDVAFKENKTVYEDCFLGLMNFVLPIFCDDKLVAYCVGGGVIDETSPDKNELLEKYGTVAKLRENFQFYAQMLEKQFDLLNFKFLRQKECFYGEKKIFGDELTSREEEIAVAICEGLSAKEIAKKYFISERTVKTHTSNIFGKLNVKNRVQLMLEYNARMD